MILISYKLSLAWISVLLCTSLFAPTIQVNSAPLPNDPASGNLGNTQDPLYHALEETYPLKLRVELKHVSLVILSGSAQPDDDDFEIPRKGDCTLNSNSVFDVSHELMDLKVKAIFPSRNEFKREEQNLKDLVPYKSKGNCVDYVEKALKQLVGRGKLEEIPKEFTDWKAGHKKPTLQRKLINKFTPKSNRYKALD
ncbi:hypothetical protein BDP27DRAFT_1444631 [Rhodocollybia butyracea]|uniref:Uncharacterized protein n=1 Tax=Rhodocollybia butyracea TaxID=206335 RepID=A0A9P5Q2V4_9AGAR|nr:hypothetical protein BDP27DRAFT_1444631 [Rhodocollybia butyracea]